MKTRRVTVDEVLSDPNGWVGETVTVIGILAAHRFGGPYWLADPHLGENAPSRLGDGEPGSSLLLVHDDLLKVFWRHQVFPAVGGSWTYWYPAEVTGTIGHSQAPEFALALSELREIQVSEPGSGTHRICF